MAQVNITSIQFEESFGQKGTGLNLRVTEAAGLNKFQTIQATGAVGSATRAIGILAADTGIYESINAGFYPAGTIARTFREGWMTVDRVIAAGTQIRLGANGILDDAGTGAIIGVVYESATTEARPGTSAVYFNFASVN